jgi:hypothetical protein
MDQPPSFVHTTPPDQVCKLHKAIHGLKQAPRAWFTRLSNFLLELGFKGSLVDTSLFIYLHGSVQVHMLVYSDDITITGTHPIVISTFILKLQQEFPLKDLGPLNFFLGIQVIQTTSSLHLCHTNYILEILRKAHTVDSKPSKSPCVSGSKLSTYVGDPLTNPTTYR